MSVQTIATISNGELLINDHNDNGLRDSSDAVVIKQSGSDKLDRSPAAIQAALREFYLDAVPVGTQLNPLVLFCQTIQKAKIQAANGDIDGLYDSIELADKQASAAGINFNHFTVRRELTQIADPIAYRNAVVSIEQKILQGQFVEALEDLRKAESYASIANIHEKKLADLSSQVFQGAYHQQINRALTAARNELSMSVSSHLYSAAIEFAQTAKIDNETVRADLDRVYLVLAEGIKSWSIEPEVHQATDAMYPLAPDVQGREYEKLINAALEAAQKGDSIKTCVRLFAAMDANYDEGRQDDRTIMSDVEIASLVLAEAIKNKKAK